MSDVDHMQQAEEVGKSANPGKAPCSALKLFKRAFSVKRTPRSAEYKAGVHAHLKYRMKESGRFACPYVEGTAQADAWWSGVTESWQILEANDADARGPSRKAKTERTL